MKSLFSLVLFFLLSLSVKAQAPPFHWAKDFKESVISGIVVDDSENIYITGGFKGKLDLDLGADTFYISSHGGYDGFIAKFNYKGEPVWAKVFGGLYDDVGLVGIKIDKSGNIYTSGSFLGSVDFDPGPGTFILTSKADNDVFVLKLNNKGELLWVKSMGGSGEERAYKIGIDDSGNVYTFGLYNAVTDFDPGPGVFSMPLTYIPVAQHLFISKLSKDGNFVWAKSLYRRDIKGGTYPFAIDIDKKGNVYLAVYNGLDLDPGPAEILDTTIYCPVILKLNHKGEYVWSKKLVGKVPLFGSFNVSDIKIDRNGDLNTLFGLTGIVDADPGPAYLEVDCKGSFLSKLDSNGNYIWGKGFAGDDNIFSRLDVDSLNSVYITGSFEGKSDFDPGPDTLFLHTDYTNRDVFISKLDKDGDFKWAVQFGGPSYEMARGITLSKRGNIYTTGYFRDSMDFAPGIDTAFSISKTGGAYLHKMSRCQTGSSLVEDACNKFSLGTYVYTKTGKYTPFFIDSYGCDSIVKLTLNVTALSDSVVISGTTIVAVEAATTYQWVKCPSYTAIPGATGKFYTAPTTPSGSYAVIMTKGLCRDTSKCISFIGTAINEYGTEPRVVIAPNPNNGEFMIQIDEQMIGAIANVYNVLGQQIRTTELSNSLSSQYLQSGVYFIEILKGEYKTMHKLIVR